MTSVNIYRKLGFSKEESQDIVKNLNLLLANYQIHYQKLRNFHWNVTGRDFFELHELFETLYNEAKLNIDAIAERIRVFGLTPLSTLRDYLEYALIVEPIKTLSGEEMVASIIKDFEDLLSFMVDTGNTAATVGDLGTVNLINGFIEVLEKHHWMLQTWIKD